MLKWLTNLFSRPRTWTQPLVGEQSDAFAQLLTDALGQRGFVFDPTTGSATKAHQVFHFGNLARECAMMDSESWPSQIDGWLDAMTAKEPDLSDFTAIADMLSMKLFVHEPPGFSKGINGEVFGHLYALVCVDTPHNIASVPADTVEGWGRSYSDLKAKALQNFADQELVEEEQVDLGEGVIIEDQLGNAYCVCGLALTKKPSNALGLFLSVPSRHHVRVHEIVGPTSMRALVVLATEAVQLVQTTPGALSPHLFWLHPDGNITTIHVGLKDDGGPLVVAPDELETLWA